MVLERRSNAQTGYEWENEDLCVEIDSLKKQPQKKLSTSVVRLQLCHLSFSLIFWPSSPLTRPPTNHWCFSHLTTAHHVDHRRQMGGGDFRGAQRGR